MPLVLFPTGINNCFGLTAVINYCIMHKLWGNLALPPTYTFKYNLEFCEDDDTSFTLNFNFIMSFSHRKFRISLLVLRLKALVVLRTSSNEKLPTVVFCLDIKFKNHFNYPLSYYLFQYKLFENGFNLISQLVNL